MRICVGELSNDFSIQLSPVSFENSWKKGENLKTSVGNMAESKEISSLEDILEAHLPDRELSEVKRILYGRQLE